jgi:hypothetical protein
MNWSGYSRFVGDVFGAPLAIEAMVALPPNRGDEQGPTPVALGAGSEADDEAGDLDDALDDESDDETDGQTPGDDAAPAPAAQSGGRPDRRRRPRQATAGRMSSGAAI